MTRLGITVIALAIVPAVLAAQTDSSRMRDTTGGRGRRQQTSSGAIGRGQRLTRDQVAQLQTALQGANCDPGAIDSVMGPHTRRAMNCARQKNNIAGNNPNDLYRALNLDFAHSDTTGANTNATSRPRGTRSTRSGGMRGDSTGMRSTRRDSTRRPGTRRDTTRPRG